MKVLASQRGMTIIEMMIALAISSIVLFAMLTMFDTQQKQIRGLYQKSEMLDLRNLMTQQLSKGATCTWQLAGKAIDVSMNPTAASPSPTVVNLNELYQGPDATSALLAKVGEPLPNTTSGLVVQAISLKNVYATGNPNEYMGTLEVQFDPARLVFAMRAVQIQKTFQVNPADPATAKSILGCGNATTSSVKRFCNTWNNDPAGPHPYGCDAPVDGKCHIPNSENSLGCFLIGVDDDSGRIGSAGAGGFSMPYISGGQTYTRIDVPPPYSDVQKCEITPDPAGGWQYRAYFSCELITCTYACLFP